MEGQQKHIDNVKCTENYFLNLQRNELMLSSLIHCIALVCSHLLSAKQQTSASNKHRQKKRNTGLSPVGAHMTSNGRSALCTNKQLLA